MEKWKDIESYGYQVSNIGRIRNSNGLTMKPSITNAGYESVKLCKHSKHKHHPIHKMVATYFVKNPNNYNVINHKDGNKLNNHYMNLEWTTSTKNNQHAYDTGLKLRGEKASFSKLTKQEVIEIRKLHKTGFGKNKIKRMLNLDVSVGAIQQVYQYKTWKHI